MIFRGRYYYLSNMYECEIKINDEFTFSSVESAFQACKSKDKDVRRMFLDKNGFESKRLGRRIELREDWNDVRLNIMYGLLWIKFNNNDDLKRLLLSSGNEELVEDNSWGDRFWGRCNGVGENNLGKLLMIVRKKLREENK